MAAQLDQQQLLNIAKEMVADDDAKMPDYLTPNEEEVVKDLIKELRAAQLAMKTYVQARIFQDSYRNALAAKSAMLTTKENLFQSNQDYLNYATRLNALIKQTKQNMAKLNAGELRDVRELNKTIDRCSESIFKTFREHGIVPNSSTYRGHKDFIVNFETNTYLMSQQVAGPGMVDQYKKMCKKYVVWEDKLNRINPSLANTYNTWRNEMVRAISDLQTWYGVPSRDVQATLKARTEMAQRGVQRTSKAYAKASTDYAAASDFAEVQRQKTLTMGRWYLIAAMGDVLLELGQNLSC